MAQAIHRKAVAAVNGFPPVLCFDVYKLTSATKAGNIGDLWSFLMRGGDPDVQAVFDSIFGIEKMRFSTFWFWIFRNWCLAAGKVIRPRRPFPPETPKKAGAAEQMRDIKDLRKKCRSRPGADPEQVRSGADRNPVLTIRQ